MRNQLLMVASIIAGCGGSSATSTDGGTSVSSPGIM
jgi:hypothetical protein